MKQEQSFILPALAIIVAAWMLTDAYRDVRLAGEGVTVKGTAERQLSSDRALWKGTVSASAQDRSQAFTRLSKDMLGVEAWLRERGMEDKDWSWSTLQSVSHNRRDAHGNWTEDIASWTLEKRLALSSQDVHEVARLAEASDSLVQAGLSWNSWQPEFYVSDLDEVKLELVEEATRNARARAERFVAGGGGKLGLLSGARQGVFQVTQPLSTEMEGYGMYDTRSIEKTLKAVVTAEFSLE